MREEVGPEALSDSPHRTPCFHCCPTVSSLHNNQSSLFKSDHVMSTPSLSPLPHALHYACQPLSFHRASAQATPSAGNASPLDRHAGNPFKSARLLSSQCSRPLPLYLKLQQSQPPLLCSTFSTAHITYLLSLWFTVYLLF